MNEEPVNCGRIAEAERGNGKKRYGGMDSERWIYRENKVEQVGKKGGEGRGKRGRGRAREYVIDRAESCQVKASGVGKTDSANVVGIVSFRQRRLKSKFPSFGARAGRSGGLAPTYQSY